MDPLSRRKIMAATLGGGVSLAAATARAQGTSQVPEPIEKGVGANMIGPQNVPVDRQNPDLLRPPRTDHGDLPNMKWSFADSHIRLEQGGWARQTTTRELPVSKEIAGVDMRLEAGTIRELHWHKATEWALMLKGKARVTMVDQLGRSFVDDVSQGDLWFFPSGMPHSIQGLEPEGAEFLLVFDNGDFSENNTFLISDWFRHTPKDVLAKNFQCDASAFDNIPEELYIFKADVPPPLQQDIPSDPKGRTPQAFTFKMMDVKPQTFKGGSVRIVDQRNFPATTTAMAFVEVEPGGMREMHWHPTVDEWQYYISGKGRMTVFGAATNARTFDFQAGDVGYAPFAMGHYIENTGSETLRFLEMFKNPIYEDVSLRQWMAVLPPELVQAHLHLPKELVAGLPKTKKLVIG